MCVCRGIGCEIFCCGCSHVLAAYASFLWEGDEDEEEDEAGLDSHTFMVAQVVAGSVASDHSSVLFREINHNL